MGGMGGMGMGGMPGMGGPEGDSGAAGRRNVRLPPEVNRILYVRNLPYKISADELYDDIYDAKNAMDHLSGFNVAGRYLVLLYYNPAKMQQKVDARSKREDIDKLKKKYGVE